VKRALLLSVCLSAALAPSAQAGWRIDRATAIAEIVWGDPCSERVTLAWAPIANTAQALDCTVTFQSTGRRTWLEFCSDVLHEYGHLAGAKHTDHGIMQPGDAYEDPRCRKRGRPYLERHGIR
jgi:hypothetical protein